MRRYLMRATASPFHNPTHADALLTNSMSSNSGNLLFSYSLTRALMREGVEVDYIKTSRKVEDDEAERINAEYDAFVIPLANAFRSSFMKELDKLTHLVERLDIPCVVVGVGYQGDLNDDGSKPNEWDDKVSRFCDAVLAKSSTIGLRGEATARYLMRLGYREGEHFDVIGCPSMFLYGPDLPKPKALTLNEDTKLCCNVKPALAPAVHSYIRGVCECFPEFRFIAQNRFELQTIYCGMNMHTAYGRRLPIPSDYPIDYTASLYRGNHARGFVTAHAWLEYMRNRDISFGTRIHGNIVGVLSGLPVYILAPDSRVKELAEYHCIPHTTIDRLESGRNVFELLDGVDFDSVLHGHRERYDRYRAFLERNGLFTVFEEAGGGPTLFDSRIAAIDFHGPVKPMLFKPYDEQVQALAYWNEVVEGKDRKIAALEEKNADLKAKLKQRSNPLRRLAAKTLRR